jgi:hypothetical protein
MKPKTLNKDHHEPPDLTETSNILTISWEDSLGKEVKLFWESFDEE